MLTAYWLGYVLARAMRYNLCATNSPIGASHQGMARRLLWTTAQYQKGRPVRDAVDGVMPQPGTAIPADPASTPLAHEDPLATQSRLCRDLARLGIPRDWNENDLRAVLVLDQHAHVTTRRLLTAYVEGNAQQNLFDARYLISARLLSRSFAQAHERLLAPMQERAADRWRKGGVTLLVQLFRHREAELLLRLLRYKRHGSEQWRQLHDAYRMAQTRSLAHEPAYSVADHESETERTLHRQFIDLLLLGALSTGQFSPRELLWASDWIAGWSGGLRLQPFDAADASRRGATGFVVDLAGSEGLKRSRLGVQGDLHLDTAPLIATIDREIAALSGSAADDPGEAPSTGHDASIALLSKLRILFSPKPVHITRRGDRKHIAMAVQSVSALRYIVQVVREEEKNRAREFAKASGRAEGITITQPSRGAHAGSPTSVFHARSAAPLTISAETVTAPKAWQVRDWSDSGCRLRGRAADLNEVIPGSLISLRENPDADWTIAIVRRLRRLMVDHVEMSLEFIGRKPRFVKLIDGPWPVPIAMDAAGFRPRSFGALYLPISERRPTLPIKTLVVPVHTFSVGRVVSILSSSGTYSLRFNKPLEQHADFVWTTFSLMDGQ